MSQDRREALVRKYLDEVFNGHDVSRLDKYLDADLSFRTGWETGRCRAVPSGGTPGPDSSPPFPTPPIRWRTSSSPATRACGEEPGARPSAGIGKTSRPRAGRRPGRS